VIGSKRQYAAHGVGGLEDRAKSGRPARIAAVEIVLPTLEPQALGVTHWSSRLLAMHLGVLLHRDHNLEEVGTAAVAGADVQVLHRSRARGQDPRRRRALSKPPEQGVPIRLGVPERQTHDTSEHGTTTLSPRWRVATGSH